MTPSSRPSARLALAVAAVGLLLPAVPALAGGSEGAAAAHPALDVVTCSGGTCEGTSASDTIVASNNLEKVYGYGGDDDIELDVAFPSGSNDIGIGGPGRDCIDGGGGADLMLGGPGDDNRTCEFAAFVDPRAALTGGPGNDTIDGGPGDDSMNGIFDDDTLIGGPGDDLLNDPSPLDKDRLLGGPGTDTLDARDGDGADIVDGGPGKDDCSGDATDRFVGCEVIHRL
jgi:Ca2+-binding RTX toxin-like protein